MPSIPPAMSRARAAAVLALLIAGHGSGAGAIPVANPGFENVAGLAPFNEFHFGVPVGWSVYDPNPAPGIVGDARGSDDIWLGTLAAPPPPGPPAPSEFFPGGAPEGGRVAIAFGRAGVAGTGEYGLQQTLAAVLEANTAYTLSVEIGNIGSGDSVGPPVEFFALGGFPGYRVELLAGGAVVAADDNSLAGSIPEYEFRTATVTLAVGAAHPRLGQPLGIRLVNLNQTVPAISGVDQDVEVDFDDVRLVATPVPEPATLGLLLGVLGALPALGRGWRRRRGATAPLTGRGARRTSGG